MIAGLDYGTSNCAIGVWRQGRVDLVPLEDGRTLIPSTLHAPARNLLVPLPKQRPADPTRYALNPQIWPDLRFGAAATAAYLQSPREGFYVKSPKSFLGARGLSPEIQDRFTAFVTAMMRNLFDQAGRFSGEAPEAIVIGRPVNFQGTQAEDDNRRATAILEVAARSGGFRDVAFLFEPMAAAMELEARLDRETRVLVVDVGGGTTDCSFIRIGPSRRDKVDRSDDILGHSGERIGGNDYDQWLAFHGVMPEFGLGEHRVNGLPVPNHLFLDAVAINDVNAQQRFYADNTTEQLQRYAAEMDTARSCARLLRLQQDRASWRLVAAAERGKIDLSDTSVTEIDIGFVVPDLRVRITREFLQDCTRTLVDHLRALLRDVLTQGNTTPDLVYLTGGMARASLTRACVSSVLPGLPLVDSDHFLSVTEGLTLRAGRLFG